MQGNGYTPQMVVPPHASPIGWSGAHGVATSPVVKKVVRLDVPVDKYPNVYNYIYTYSLTVLANAFI
jgi:protein quaking